MPLQSESVNQMDGIDPLQNSLWRFWGQDTELSHITELGELTLHCPLCGK